MASTYQIDPSHSHISFSIRHLMISNVRGSFSGVNGTIAFDPQNPAVSSLNAEVDVQSINTLDANRDQHLKSPDFFDAAQYPKMTFASTNVEKIADDEYRVAGNLTIHGITKPVTLQVEDVAPETKDPWGKQRIAATVKGKINRKDFGLTWSAPLETGGVVVGDEVKIEMDIQAVKA